MAVMDQNFELFTTLRYDPALANRSGGEDLVLVSGDLKAFYMLPFHRDRMLEASEHFGWEKVSARLQDEDNFYENLVVEVRSYQAQNDALGKPLRIRIVLNQFAETKIEIGDTPPVPPNALFPTLLATLVGMQAASIKPDHLITSGELESMAFPAESSAFIAQIPEWRLYLDSAPTLSTSFTEYKTTSRDHYAQARSRALPTTSSFSGPGEVIMWNPAGQVTEGSLTSLYFHRNGRWVTPPAACGGQRGTTRRWALEQGLCVEETVPRESVRDGEVVWVSNGLRGFGYGKVSLRRNDLGSYN